MKFIVDADALTGDECKALKALAEGDGAAVLKVPPAVQIYAIGPDLYRVSKTIEGGLSFGLATGGINHPGDIRRGAVLGLARRSEP